MRGAPGRRASRSRPLGVGAVAPVARHEVDDSPSRSARSRHSGGEVAGLERQHAVAGRERVHQRGLPRAGPGRRVDDDRPARAEHPRQPLEDVGASARRTPGRGGRSSARPSRAGRDRGRWSARGSGGNVDRSVARIVGRSLAPISAGKASAGMRDTRRVSGRASLSLALLVVALCSAALSACGSGRPPASRGCSPSRCPRTRTRSTRDVPRS